MRAKGSVLLLILNILMPMGSVAEGKPDFDITFFDRNADGIDDRMNHLLQDGEDVAVILMLNSKPSEEHVKEIENLGLEVTHIYKYIDALRIVADGVNALRSLERGFLVITHYQRLLDYIIPDFVHVLVDGKIVKSGGKELALELEENGYVAFEEMA